MSVFNLYPTINPTLSFDFVNARTLDPSITFTRNTSATYFDETGILRVAGANVPRLDYDPATLAARGFLIEEQRTNSIRNSTMQGAVAGTPGTLPTNWAAATPSNGLNREIVGVGTEDGINYIDIKYSGTTSSASLTPIYPEGSQQVVATTGQTWSSSFYVSLVGGSTANITSVVVGIDENNSLGNFLIGSSTVFTPSSGALNSKRYAHTRTTTNASTAYVRNYVFFQYASGVAIDITLRIGLPQLELGAFATSVMPTTTTALTRTADVASVNTLSPWFNATESTLYAEVLLANLPVTSTFPVYVGFNDGLTINNTIHLSSNSFANHRVSVRSGGASLWDVNAGGSIVAGTPSKWALAVASGSQAACANGGAVATNSAAGLPTGLSRLGIGSQYLGTGQATAWMRRITYYPSRLSNAQLQALTA